MIITSKVIMKKKSRKGLLLVLFAILILVSIRALELRLVSAEKLNVRESAKTESEVVTQVLKGDIVRVLQEKNGWAKVKTSSHKGYIASSLISKNIKATKFSQSIFEFSKVEYSFGKLLEQSFLSFLLFFLFISTLILIITILK